MRNFSQRQVRRWTIGDVTITRIVERTLEGTLDGLIPMATPGRLIEHDWLVPNHVLPDGRLRFSVHALHRARVAALRAALRARDTLACAPELQRSAPVPTSWLLARFQDYLNVGRREAAMRIAIYSLTESSSRQAKAAIEEITLSVTVDTNADHGGSARLRALAENSDLFVMTWLSAKHAATDFIREHRGNKTLLYSQGKGSSTILRAIKNHLLRPVD